MSTENDHANADAKKPVVISMDGSEHADYAFHCKSFPFLSLLFKGTLLLSISTG